MEPHEKRMLLLRNITWETRHGFVDGVEIDLRHESLQADSWRLIWYFGSSACCCTPEGPCLIFPWSLEDWSYLPPKSWRPRTLRPGDRVRIDHVTSVQFRDMELSHPADREFREAYLIVERPNGRKSFVPRPLQFWPPTSLSRPRRAGRPTFDTISTRICHELGILDVDSFDLIAEELTRAEAALESAKNAKLHYNLLTKKFINSQEQNIDIDITIRELIDDAVSLGYHAAKLDSERFIEPRAKRDIERAIASERGGKHSGNARRQRAHLWHTHAAEIVAEILREPGPHKREALVYEIQNRWRWPQINVPGDRSLWGLLRELDNSGNLPL